MLSNHPTLILGSSSPTRALILNQMRLCFQALSPDIDESVKHNEPVDHYVSRLSIEKAHAVHAKITEPGHYLIIASDQVAADTNGIIYGKPETLENALSMLRALSGQTIKYYCGVSVLSTETKNIYTDISVTEVTFKKITDEQIIRYLSLEPSSLQCASSLKIESIGPALIDSFSSNDPSSCQGLPCLLLDKLINKHGYHLFDFAMAQKVFA